LDVRDKGDAGRGAEPRQKPIRPPCACRLTVQGGVEVGAVKRHGLESSPRPGPTGYAAGMYIHPV
jgi:hypothetical protein